MPELPEVETIARSLRNPSNPENIDAPSLNNRPGVVGRVIKSVEVNWPRSIAVPSKLEFEKSLPGQTILEVGRRGKFLVFRLKHWFLLIHLRMSGDIRVEPGGTPINKHDRVVLGFRDGWKMVFNDPRKFGRVWLAKSINEVTGNLGFEPLDETLSAGQLWQRFQSTSRKIKSVLLDQGVIAGLGNIYTDEALFLSGINPLTPANELSELNTESLLRSIRLVLMEGIARNGASIDWVYRGGEFQNHFNVYQQTGKPCPVCGTPIKRVVVGQRGTHFCPHCQVDLTNKQP